MAAPAVHGPEPTGADPAAGRGLGPVVRAGAWVVSRLLAAVFPRRCPVCGAPHAGRGPDLPPSAAGFDLLLPRVLCPACRRDFRPLASPLCPRCGLMFTSRVGRDHLCGRCILRAPAFAAARAAGVYEGALMQAGAPVEIRRQDPACAPPRSPALRHLAALRSAGRRRSGGAGAPSPAPLSRAGLQPGLSAGA